MANNEHFLVGIDIGSSKIAVLIAEEKAEKLSIFGHSKDYSAGVEKGSIVDIDKITQSIKTAVKAINRNYNIDFHNVSVNISDPNLTAVNQTGQSAISNNTVDEYDMVVAINNARTMSLHNKQIINSIVNYWTLDADPITHKGVVIDNPIGQRANTLEVSMHLVITPTQQVNNIEQSIRNSNLGLANVVLNSVASSETYITQGEKNQGVCLLDIGAEVTNIAVFTKQGFIYNSVILSAGLQISQQIASVFNTSIKEAERLKITYGYAQTKLINEDKLIEFQQIDDKENAFHYLSQQQLIVVIERAYLSLFALIKQNLTTISNTPYQSLKSGFVLTGGASKIRGCEKLLLSYFKIRSKVGRVNTDRIEGKQAVLNNPEYGCAMGLLLFEPNALDMEKMQKQGFLGKIKHTFKRV